MKRAVLRTSFFSMNCCGLKFFTSPAKRVVKAEGSKSSMVEMPMRPSRMPRHVSSVPMPTELSRPTPVTTTLRAKTFPASLLFSDLVVDIVDGVFNCGYLFGIFVGDVNVEGLLERHDE